MMIEIGSRHGWRRVALLTSALVLALAALPHAAPIFHACFPALSHPIYTRSSLLSLTLAHLALVSLASLLAITIGLALGVAATRRSARALLPTVQAVAVIGQTLPPVAVLALAVPLLGFGGPPTLLALTIYGVLPVLGHSVAGLLNVPAELIDAADGMGYGASRRLRELELPLALEQIMAGVRISVIVAVGTATIGSTVGATTLGAPIIEGLVANNTAYVIQGVLLVGLLALWIDALLDVLADGLRRHGSRSGGGGVGRRRPRSAHANSNGGSRRISVEGSRMANLAARRGVANERFALRRQSLTSRQFGWCCLRYSPALLVAAALAQLVPVASAAPRVEPRWQIESFCHRPVDPAHRCLIRARQGIITLTVAQLPSAPSVHWQGDVAVLQSHDREGSKWWFLIPPQQLSIAYQDVLAFQASHRLLAYRDGAVVHLVELFKPIGRHDWLTLPDDARGPTVRANFDGETLDVRWSDQAGRAHQQALRLPSTDNKARQAAARSR